MYEENERLEKQIAFLLECDKSKSIGRQTYIADGTRKENDAEHSWHLALMAMLLSEYSNEKVDVLRTVCMVTVHDLVEIYAGDTYAYDSGGSETKRKRELEAADRLFGMLPSDQAEYMRSLWDEFEERKTPEARFAAALDHIQPILLNDASDGKSWIEHGVKLSMVMNRNISMPEGSKTLWEYAKNRCIMPNVDAGALLDDREKSTDR